MLEPVPDDSPDDAPLAVVEGPDDSNRSIYTPVTQTVDNVNHPQHYKHGEIETLDIIRMSLTAEEFQGFLKGQRAEISDTGAAQARNAGRGLQESEVLL